MESLNEKKPDANEVFARWLADVRVDNLSRYSYGDRKKHVQNLMGFLLQNSINKDDAQMLKRRVVEVLVSEKGMKGKDKHRGWKENVEADFNDAIQLAYVPGLRDVSIERLKTSSGHDPDIVTWIKKRFGDHVGPEMIKAAHQPGHTLWMMFVNEHFNRDTGGIL